MWSVFLNSAHTEFSSEQDCVVFSAHLTADGHSLNQLSAAYFFLLLFFFNFVLHCVLGAKFSSKQDRSL